MTIQSRLELVMQAAKEMEASARQCRQINLAISMVTCIESQPQPQPYATKEPHA